MLAPPFCKKFVSYIMGKHEVLPRRVAGGVVERDADVACKVGLSSVAGKRFLLEARILVET